MAKPNPTTMRCLSRVLTIMVPRPRLDILSRLCTVQTAAPGPAWVTTDARALLSQVLKQVLEAAPVSVVCTKLSAVAHRLTEPRPASLSMVQPPSLVAPATMT